MAQLDKKAWEVMELSIKRAGIRHPKWARTSKLRWKMFAVYMKAARKNKFRFSYGKDGTTFYHVDHIVPLHGEHVSGLHVPWNLKVIRADINMAKRTLIVEEWIPQANDELEGERLRRLHQIEHENWINR